MRGGYLQNIYELTGFCFWVMMCCGFLQVKVMAKFYWGDPKDKLVKAVVETPLDALVMGSRGYGTFAR